MSTEWWADTHASRMSEAQWLHTSVSYASNRSAGSFVWPVWLNTLEHCLKTFFFFFCIMYDLGLGTKPRRVIVPSLVSCLDHEQGSLSCPSYYLAAALSYTCFCFFRTFIDYRFVFQPVSVLLPSLAKLLQLDALKSDRLPYFMALSESIIRERKHQENVRWTSSFDISTCEGFSFWFNVVSKAPSHACVCLRPSSC